jgi:hypothetical protein
MYKSDGRIVSMNPAYLIDRRTCRVVAEIKPASAYADIAHFDPYWGTAIPQLLAPWPVSSAFWMVVGFAFSQTSGAMLSKFSDLPMPDMENYFAVDKHDFDYGMSAPWVSDVTGYGWRCGTLEDMALVNEHRSKLSARYVDLSQPVAVLFDRRVVAELPADTLQDYRNARVLGILQLDKLREQAQSVPNDKLPGMLVDDNAQPVTSGSAILSFDLRTGVGIVPRDVACTYVPGWAIVNSANLQASGWLVPDSVGPYAEQTVPQIPHTLPEANRAVVEQLHTAAQAMINAGKLLRQVDFGETEQGQRPVYCGVRDDMQYAIDDVLSLIERLSQFVPTHNQE